MGTDIEMENQQKSNDLVNQLRELIAEVRAREEERGREMQRHAGTLEGLGAELDWEKSINKNLLADLHKALRDGTPLGVGPTDSTEIEKLKAEIARIKNPNPTIGEPRNEDGDPFINSSYYIAHHLWELLRLRQSGQDWWGDVRNWCQRRLRKDDFERPSPDAWKWLTAETVDAIRAEPPRLLTRAMITRLAVAVGRSHDAGFAEQLKEWAKTENQKTAKEAL